MKIYKITSPPPKETSRRDIYVGIDVHSKTWHVTIVLEGRIVLSMSIPAQWRVLEGILDRYRKYCIHAVYEAGYFGYRLYDQLLSYGADCIVTPPSLIPREYGNRVKTDRLDSKRLAVLLSQGALKRIAVPTEEQRSHQTVIRRPCSIGEGLRQNTATDKSRSSHAWYPVSGGAREMVAHLCGESPQTRVQRPVACRKFSTTPRTV